MNVVKGSLLSSSTSSVEDHHRRRTSRMSRLHDSSLQVPSSNSPSSQTTPMTVPLSRLQSSNQQLNFFPPPHGYFNRGFHHPPSRLPIISHPHPFFDVNLTLMSAPHAVMPLPPPPYSTLPGPLNGRNNNSSSNQISLPPSIVRPTSPPIHLENTTGNDDDANRVNSQDGNQRNRSSLNRRFLDSFLNSLGFFGIGRRDRFFPFGSNEDTDMSPSQRQPVSQTSHQHHQQSSSSTLPPSLSSVPSPTVRQQQEEQFSSTQSSFPTTTSPTQTTAVRRERSLSPTNNHTTIPDDGCNNNNNDSTTSLPVLPSYHTLYSSTSPASMRRRRRRMLRQQRLIESALMPDGRTSSPTLMPSSSLTDTSSYLTENKKYLVFVSLFILGIVLTFVGVVTLSLFVITFGFTFILFSLLLYKLLPSSKYAPQLRSSIIGLTRGERGVIGRAVVNCRRSPSSMMVPANVLPLPIRSHFPFAGHHPTHPSPPPHSLPLHHPFIGISPHHLPLHHPYLITPTGPDGAAMAFALPPPPPSYQEALASGNIIQPLDAGSLQQQDGNSVVSVNNNENNNSPPTHPAGQRSHGHSRSQHCNINNNRNNNEVTVTTSAPTTSGVVIEAPSTANLSRNHLDNNNIVTIECPGRRASLPSPDVIISCHPSLQESSPNNVNVRVVNSQNQHCLRDSRTFRSLGCPQLSRIEVKEEEGNQQDGGSSNNNSNRLQLITIIEATI